MAPFALVKSQSSIVNSQSRQCAHEPSALTPSLHRSDSMISSSAALGGRVALERQGGQRLVDHVQLLEEIVAVGLDVDEARRELAAPRRLVQRRAAPRSCRSDRSLPRASSGTGVEPSCIFTSWVVPGLVIHRDVLEERHEADVLERLVVILHVGVALGRAFVVVERDARRDHVEHHRALVR